MYKQSFSWPGLPLKLQRPEPCKQTQLFQSVQRLPTHSVAVEYYLTIVMAAAATAVLTDVPGTMLLSDVLTSTATTKRLPTGSTFWGQRCNSKGGYVFAGATGCCLLWWSARDWRTLKRTYRKTFVKRSIYCFEDAAVWIPPGFTLIALASFVVFRR